MPSKLNTHSRHNSSLFPVLAFILLSSHLPVQAQKVLGGKPKEIVPQMLRTDWGYEAGASPDGKIALIGNIDASVTVWDLEQKAVIRQITDLPTYDITALGFFPDASTAYISFPSTTLLLDATTWSVKQTIPDRISAVYPDSKRYLSFSGQLWTNVDIQSGQKIISTDNRSPILKLALSADGRMVATGGADGKIRLYEAFSGQFVNEFAVPLDGFLGTINRSARRISALAFSSDGKSIFCGVGNGGPQGGEMRLYDLEGQEKGQFGKGLPRFDVDRILPLDDNKALISGNSASGNSRPVFWSDGVGTGFPAPEYVWGAARLPDGKILVNGGNGPRAGVFDLSTGRREKLLGSGSEINALQVSRDGKTVVAAYRTPNNNTDILVWNSADWTVKFKFSIAAYRVSISPDASLVLAPGQRMKLFSTADGSLVKEVREAVEAQFSADGNYLFCLASGSDRTVSTFNLKTQEIGPKTELWIVPDRINFRFSPDGSQLLSCGNDGQGILYDIPQHKTLWKGPIGYAAPLRVVWLPNDQGVLFPNPRDILELHDTKTGELIRTVGERDHAQSATLSPDGQSIFFCGTSNSSIFNLKTGVRKILPFQFRIAAWKPPFVYGAYHSVDALDSNFNLASSTTLLPTPDYAGNTDQSFTRWPNDRITTSRRAGSTKMLKQNVNGVMVDFPQPVPTAVVKSGEIGLRGAITAITTAGQLTILVSWLETPDGKLTGLYPYRAKTINIGSKTFIHVSGETTRMSAEDLKVGIMLRVIGSGNPVTVREIEVIAP